MLNCIVGAIMYCSGSIAIPGQLSYASSYPAANAWAYAIYAVPVLAAPTFLFVPGIRRG